jgi:hypothetical protein
MEAKRARMKPRNLRFVEANTVVEARYSDKRPMPMPENKSSNHDIIENYLANGGMVKRIPCRGVMPARSYGKICKGHTRAGLNLNPISERTARERPHDFAPNGLVVWSAGEASRLIKTRP